MFVECVSNNGFEDQLTETQLYKVKALGQNSYEVINDNGNAQYYGTTHFKISGVNL